MPRLFTVHSDQKRSFYKTSFTSFEEAWAFLKDANESDSYTFEPFGQWGSKPQFWTVMHPNAKACFEDVEANRPSFGPGYGVPLFNVAWCHDNFGGVSTKNYKYIAMHEFDEPKASEAAAPPSASAGVKKARVESAPVPAEPAYDAVPETTTEHVRYSIQSWRYKSNHPKTFGNFKDAWDFLKNNDIPSFGANSMYDWTMEHDSSEACFSNPETLEGVKIYNVMWTRDSEFLYPNKLYKFIVEHRWTE